MKIVADSHIPYLDGCLVEGVQLKRCETITRDDVLDADALLVRTRTSCNEALLAGTKVQFIGSATIGTDHIDLDYCRKAGIAAFNAPGCNAPAVAQWVLSGIGHWMRARGFEDAASLTMGIVGVGLVGSIVAQWSRQMGFNVLLNDPPLAAKGSSAERFSSLSELQQNCDIITFHTPLTSDGRWPTWHLCDSDFLKHASRCRLLMNAARGAVTDTQALLDWQGDLAIDCWENEPRISAELLSQAFIATPHIAGYSIEGKMRGTGMVLEALARHFGLELQKLTIETPLQGTASVSMPMVMESYNPLDDTAKLKASPENFEALRNAYPLRHEVRQLSAND